MTTIRTFGLILTAAVTGASAAQSASFGELSSGGSGSQSMAPYSAGPYAAGPYAAGPYGGGYGAAYGPGPYAPTPPFGGASSPSGGREGVPPAELDAPGTATMPPMQVSPTPYLPLGPNADLPRGRTELETFGQVNSETDPFNPWGLSTPFMFVPWSTPLSGWANAQTWNWWRERSGALPRNW